MPVQIPTSTLPSARKTYLVGMDGSDLSFRALRLAATLADDMKDNVVVVHVSEKVDAKTLESKCTDALLHRGVQRRRQAFHVYERTGEWDIGGLLIWLANKIAKGAGVLVLGAAGKAGEDEGRKGPLGQLPMGSVALKCQETCKVPVVIVKSTQSPVTAPELARGKRPSRCGDTAGLHYAVCVDASNLSRMAFDTALLFARKVDSLHLIHIENTDLAVTDRNVDQAEMVRRLYLAECEKLVNLGQVKEATLSVVLKKQSIKEHINEFVESRLVDVVLMGSAELSKARKNKLGSVCSSVGRDSYAHVCIVKNFNTV